MEVVTEVPTMVVRGASNKGRFYICSGEWQMDSTMGMTPKRSSQVSALLVSYTYNGGSCSEVLASVGRKRSPFDGCSVHGVSRHAHNARRQEKVGSNYENFRLEVGMITSACGGHCSDLDTDHNPGKVFHQLHNVNE